MDVHLLAHAKENFVCRDFKAKTDKTHVWDICNIRSGQEAPWSQLIWYSSNVCLSTTFEDVSSRLLPDVPK